MSKEYIPKQFTPFIYPEWGELFDELTDEQNAEILKAITKFPDYEPENILVWKFIKSQLQKDYDNFKAKCKKRGEASRTYWGNKGEQMISNEIESLPSDNKGEPKPLTTNHLPLTTNHLPLTETQTETRIDYLANPIIEQVFKIYKTHCTNLVKLDRYYTRNIELKKLVGTYLEQTESNLEYFTRVCDIANNIKKIGSVNVDIKMVLKNHDGFYNGKYQSENDNDYSSHNDLDWIKEIEKRGLNEHLDIA